MMRTLLATILAAVLAAPLSAQSVRSLIDDGNAEYGKEKYTDAEVNYRKAIEKDRELIPGLFNLGNALHKQGKHDEAMREFGNAASRSHDGNVRANSMYNIGNSHLRLQQYKEAINAYTEALKINPADADAKYNLSYALEMLRRQQEQQQQQQNQQNQQQNRNQQNQQQQQQQQQEQEARKQKEQQQRRQQQAAEEQRRLSKEQAERILDVLKDSERDIQKKLRVRQAVRAKTEKDW